MATNIVGEPTPEYVIKQVEARQKIHGKTLRSNEDLVYLNSKTAWVKLASSVNVEQTIANPTIKNLGLFENNLAKEFILFNGTTSGSTQKSGIARDKSINNNNAYGLGGLEFGISPMMGIQSAIINYKNRGSIRSAKVDIIANNRQQFEIIETLYIKLGYFMLLEWGWSNYVKNDGTFAHDNSYSIVNSFLKRDKGYDSLLSIIESNKKKSEGNYDALIGKVTNFTWTFTPEGQYKISLDLISMGDVIESLKVNTLLPQDMEKSNKPPVSGSQAPSGSSNSGESNSEIPPEFLDGELTSKEVIISYMDKNSLGNFFGKNVKALDKNNRLSKTINGKKVISFLKTEYVGESADGEGTTIYYVLFQRLLLYIEEYLIPTIKKGKAKFINFDLDTEEQLILLPPLTLSTDPRICNFNSQWKHGEKTGFSTLYGSEDFTKTVGDNTHGRLLNVYFNIQWILETLDTLADDKGNVVLIDFLNALLRGYESCTGNYNSISPDIDDTTNTVVFRDEVQSPDRQKNIENKPTAKFNTFGYNGSQSNFIKNLQFNTTITPKLASMITIGATKDGSHPGYDATGLTAINAGTFDAIKPDLVNNSGKETKPEGEESSTEDKIKNLEEKYKVAKDNFNNYVKLLTGYGNNKKPTLDIEAANSYKSTIKNFIEYNQLKAVKESDKKNASSPTTGFIPFDLGLTIDGLSGIKIYQKIEVENKFLPYSYPRSINFVIKGVEHTINNNQWTTNLTTLAIPRSTVGSGKEANLTDGSTPQGIGGGGSGGGGTRGGDDPSSWTNKTITSGFPLNPRGHDKTKYNKTQVVLHYSAGWQKTDKGQSTIDTLNKRGLSYHYIIDANGHVEHIVPDRVRAFNAGNANPTSIGISLQNVGYGKNATESSYGPMRKDQLTGNAHLVDHNGKNTTYRGISYAQEITDAQLASLKKLFKEIYKNNPTLPSYKWEGKKTYDFLFPPDKNGVKQTNWSKGKPGYYTHCGITTGKLDCMPTPKIVNFFKSLKLSGPQKLKEADIPVDPTVSLNAFKTLATKIQSIYNLTDNENPTGPGKLFEPAKGTLNDDEEAAIKLLNKWFTSQQIQDLYLDLNEEDKKVFDKAFDYLKRRTVGDKGKVLFKSGDISILVNSDF